MKTKNFSSLKNACYIIYMVITAFFLMNDYKLTTLVIMVVLVIIATVRASEGKPYTYPLTIPFVR